MKVFDKRMLASIIMRLMVNNIIYKFFTLDNLSKRLTNWDYIFPSILIKKIFWTNYGQLNLEYN